MDVQLLVILVVASVVTIFSALIAFPLLRRAGIVDVPSHRSSHTQSTVRGGGVAIGCGITVATVAAMVWNIAEHGVYALGGIVLPIGFLVLTWCYFGDRDERRPRLAQARRTADRPGCAGAAVQLNMAMLFTQGIAWHVVAFAVIGVATVNAVNFVDRTPNGYVTEWASSPEDSSPSSVRGSGRRTLHSWL